MHLSQTDEGTVVCQISKAANCMSAEKQNKTKTKKQKNRITHVE